MEINKKQFLLFVFGSFIESEDQELLIQLIGEQFLDVTEDNYLPYTFGPYFVVYKFTTDKDFDFVKTKVHDSVAEMCHSYYLTEITDNMSYKVEEDVEQNFFPEKKPQQKVPDPTPPPSIMLDLLKMVEEIQKNAQDFTEDTDFEILGMDFEKKKKSHFEKKKKSENQKKKALSLDEVLEKIAEMGIDSLTKDEKQTLDDYANGK
jgi:hypothetical protein